MGDHIHIPNILHHRSYIMQASWCSLRHASHMRHHTSYNTHHAASCIDYTKHAPTAWHFDTTCIHDARRRQQLCRVGDRSKTNCRTASSSSSTKTTSTIIIIIIASLYSGLRQNNAPCIWPASEGRTTESGLRESPSYSH